MKFTTGNVSGLSDQELINNIALLKADKVDLSNFPGISKAKLIQMHEAVLTKRGFDDDDIDLKVADAAEYIQGNDSGGKFWQTTDKVVDTAGDIVDIVGKFKGFFTKGGTYEDDTDGSEYDIKPKTDEKFNWKPYIIGGVGFVALITVTLLVLNKKNK